MNLALAISEDKSWMKEELANQAFDAHARTHRVTITITMTAAEYRQNIASLAFEGILKSPV